MLLIWCGESEYVKYGFAPNETQNYNNVSYILLSVIVDSFMISIFLKFHGTFFVCSFKKYENKMTV